MIKVVVKIKDDKHENYAQHVCFLLPTVVRLGNLQYWGILLYLNNSRAQVYCAFSRCGWCCLDNFFFRLSFLYLSPFLWELARYWLKYYLTGPLNRKTTNSFLQAWELLPAVIFAGISMYAEACSAGNGRSPGRRMRPKIIWGDHIWSEIRVFVARRIMFGRPTLNLCMHSNNWVMSVQTGCTTLQFILWFSDRRCSKTKNGTPIPFTDLGNRLQRVTDC